MASDIFTEVSEGPQVGADEHLVSARERFSTPSDVSRLGQMVGVGLTSVAVASIVLAFVLLVRSFWMFTHPQFDFELPKLPNFQVFYEHPGEQTPTRKSPKSGSGSVQDPMPTLPGVSQSEVLNFLNSVTESENPLVMKMTKSELLETGQSMCSSFHRHFLWIDHQSSRAEVLNSFIISMYGKYPLEPGIKPFANIMLDASVEHLCPNNQSVK